MANVIKHKRGSGSDPSASDLILGELAIRTDNGKLFTKMDSGAIAEIAGGGSDIAINTLSSSSATGGGSATFNGSAYRFTLSSPPSVSAAQLLVSINGVIQKPVAGTGQPSEGFSVDGNDIILGDAPATGSDFFILTFRSLGVSEPADNSVTSAKIVDGAIVNADINASAAIAGSKISPTFTSNLTISNTEPQLIFTDTNNDSDFLIKVQGGVFQIEDTTNSNADRLHIASDGTVDIFGNLDVGAGLDVTGTITATGNALIGTATSNGFRFKVSDGGGYEFAFAPNDSGVNSLVNYDRSGSAYVPFMVSGSDLRFASGGNSEKMRIDSSGNVGIGTTSPDGKLDVRGTIFVNGDATGGRIFASSGNLSLSDGNGRQILRIDDPGPSNSHTHVFDSNGRLGIGTTSPSSKLHLFGAASDFEGLRLTNNLRNDSAASSAQIKFDIRNSGGLRTARIEAREKNDNNNECELNFYTNSSASQNGEEERMTISGTGNVGIGIASPETVLHINNNVPMIRLTDANASGTPDCELGGAGGNIDISADINGEKDDSVIRFNVDGSEAMRIDAAKSLLVAHTSTRNNFNSAASTEHAPIIQLEGENQKRALSITATNNNDGGILMLARQNGNPGTNTVVSSGDQIGRVDFQASGGTNMELAAQISAEVDGTPGDNDMPGRLLFKTTADGSNSPTERMRIDKNGSVGINVGNPGTYDPNAESLVIGEISGGDGHAGMTILSSGTDKQGAIYFADGTASSSYRGRIEYDHNTDTLNLGTAGTGGHMKIDSYGGLRIGTTGPVYSELLTIVEPGTDNEIATWRVNDQSHNKDMINMIHVANSGNRVMIRFRRTGGLNSIGDITTSATSTSYGTSSDYRLKENQALISDGITRLKALKPYRFNFKADPTTTVDGFFAHEVAPVVPEAITGTKDGVDENNEPDYQTIDQSKLVPLLVAAVQELTAKVEALEAK